VASESVPDQAGRAEPTMNGRRRVGLRAKLMLPFVVVFVTSLSLLGILFIRSNQAALTESLV
jgi:hypothetical protein